MERTAAAVTRNSEVDVTPAAPIPRSWVQVGLAPRPGQQARVYAELAALAAELLAEPVVHNFFFMHKDPGLRVRFEAEPDRWEWLDQLVNRRVSRWGSLVGPVSPGCYEPEELLFGGPASMPYVHRVFTADARAWLAFHQLGEPSSAWLFSLALLRELFGGLAIVGWEDLGVWDRIVRQAGRRLPAGLDADRVATAADGIRAAWADPDRLRQALPEPARSLLGVHGPGLRAAGLDWRAGYFDTRAAVIGPREGAAFATVFHWNRGALRAGTQGLVAGALADRSARP